uniref:Uncharacterized protein n=1 Tax=Echeneis naucrates TaxID=173247 RepID=A0A665TYT6_ECHNA
MGQYAGMLQQNKVLESREAGAGHSPGCHVLLINHVFPGHSSAAFCFAPIWPFESVSLIFSTLLCNGSLNTDLVRKLGRVLKWLLSVIDHALIRGM